MQSLSNSDRSDSQNGQSSQTDSSQQTPESNFYKDLIKKANSTSIKSLFKYYSLQLDETNRKIICPLPKHQGKYGRESSASFYFYPETNSFWCFGCKTGIYPTDLVAAMESISRTAAAFQIVNLFESDPNLDFSTKEVNSNERLEILLSFSDVIREFIQSNPNQISQAEKISLVFDTLYAKHNLDNKAIISIINKLKQKLNSLCQF